MRFKNTFKLSGLLFCFQSILFALVIIGSLPNLIARTRLQAALYFSSQPNQPLLHLQTKPINYQPAPGQAVPVSLSLDSGGRHLKTITVELILDHSQGTISDFTFSPSFCGQQKSTKTQAIDLITCTTVLNLSQQFAPIASFTYTPISRGVSTLSFGPDTQATVTGISTAVHPINAPNLTFTVK